jgi:hypothetical protein
LSIQAVDFNEFCLEVDPLHLQTSPRTSSLTTIPQPRAQDPVVDFKKGNKRDAMLFAAFKDESQWDNWKTLANAQAWAQDVFHIFDSAYVPMTLEDQELFKGKQEYMYSVFC